MIANWVREARTDAGLSGAALGAKLALELGTERGHTKANISHWETGKHSPSLRQLLAIAKITERPLPPGILAAMGGANEAVDPSTLLPGAVRVVAADGNSGEFVQVQKVKLRLSAGIQGFRTEPDTYDGRTVSLPTEIVERYNLKLDKLYALRVKGESMEPALYEDDIVIVDTGDTRPVDGQVYAVNYEGEAVIKRLTRDAGDWWLSSDNPDQRKFHRKICRNGDCIIVGRVIRKESMRV